MATTVAFKSLTKPPIRQIAATQERYADLAAAGQNILRGKLNNTAQITLDVSPATSTQFDNPGVGPSSVVLLVPLTANAAALGVLRVTPDTNGGSFTVYHAADANNDLDFGVAVFG